MPETLNRPEHPEHFSDVHHENGEALMCMSSGGECKVLVEVMPGYSPEEEQQLIESTTRALEAVDQFTGGRAAEIFTGLHIKLGEDETESGGALPGENTIVLNGRKMLLSVAEMRRVSGSYDDEELADFPDVDRPGGAMEYTLVHEMGHILDGHGVDGKHPFRVSPEESPTNYGRTPDKYHDEKYHESFAEGFAHAVWEMPISETMGEAVSEAVNARVQKIENQANVGELNSVDEQFQRKFEESKIRLERSLQSKRERLTHLQESVVPRRIEAYEGRYGESPPAEWVAALTAGAELGIQRDEQQLEFMRPASDEDIAYRQKVARELPALISESCPPELPLRFHGAPIFTSREIIASRGLSSSVDRIGIETSYDVAGQVSVTMPGTLQTTLNSYTGLIEGGYEVPAGCVFVVLPESKEDADAGRSMLMGNVDFEAHPEQMFAIMTSRENVEQVRLWAKEAGLDPTKVKEFFEFADSLKGLNEAIVNGTSRTQDYVSYPI